MKTMLLVLVAAGSLLAACSANSNTVAAKPVTSATPPLATTTTVALATSTTSTMVAPTTTTALIAPGDSPTEVSFAVPSIGVKVDEKVEAIGKTFDAKAGCPNQVDGCVIPAKDKLGWYNESVLPGNVGNGIIEGHDDWDGKIEPFWNLFRVPAGTTITVSYASGKQHRFIATSGRSELKTVVQTDQSIVGPNTKPQLILITCDPGSHVVNGHHLNNFALFADLLP